MGTDSLDHLATHLVGGRSKGSQSAHQCQGQQEPASEDLVTGANGTASYCCDTGGLDMGIDYQDGSRFQ